MIPEMKYDVRWSSRTPDSISKTARLLQRQYLPVFAALDNKPSELCSAYWTLATTIHTHNLQIYPHTAMVVSHLPDLSFGFRVGVYNEKHSREKSFIRTSKKMANNDQFPSSYAKALNFFEQKATEYGWELTYHERHNAYAAMSVGDINIYGKYRAVVELSVAKVGCKIFRSSVLI